jgi:hypothetical protein
MYSKDSDEVCIMALDIKALLRLYQGVLRLVSGIVAFSHVASEMTPGFAHTFGSSG